MTGATLRRAAIFLLAAGLGIAAVTLLAGGPAGGTGSRPRVPVVQVPEGTAFQGTPGIPGFSLVDAEKGVASEVRTLEFDGVKVPFRPMVLRYATERPLPSPAKDVRRVALTDPDLLLQPIPRTRQEYEEAAKARPTRLRAPAGTLDHFPGDRMTVHLTGGARVDLDREGTPWTVEAEEATLELPSRLITAPCPVSVDSAELRAKGRRLRASEADGSLVLEEGATGTIPRSSGARLGTGPVSGDIRFGCARLCRVLRLPEAKPPDGLERFRVTLEQEAFLEQGDGRLEGPRLEVDIARPPGDDGGRSTCEAIRGEGGVTLLFGGKGRDSVARGERIQALPRADGRTDVRLDGSPSLDIREPLPSGGDRALHVAGRGQATLLFPREEGPLHAEFRGGATGVVTEPAGRRDLRANTLTLVADRRAGATEIREVRAEGKADLAEADRRARAEGISWSPLPGGGSRAVLRDSVAVAWPAAGAMDPLSSRAADPAAPDRGMLLLTTPREAILESPAPGDATGGATLSVKGGAVLRRVVGEQEVYRLTCGRLEAALQPGNRAISLLDATVDPHLEGREEGPGARRYDFRGARITVRGAPGSKEPGLAEIRGEGEANRGRAAFTAEDGRPMAVAADFLRFDRATGAFHAEGTVRGEGILPEAPPTAGRAPGGRAEIACRTLDGVLGSADRPGATRVVSLAARDEVWLKTETEYASGDRLDWDGDAARAVLRGDPARITARTAAPAPGAPKLEDLCESAVLHVRLRDGRLDEARTEGEGRVLRHRVPAAPGAPERVEARGRGPLVYTPGTTLLEGDVSLVRSLLAEGSWAEKDRVERADRVTLAHPPAAGGTAGRLEGAVAESSRAALEVHSAAGAWTASGVSRATLRVPADTLTMEASDRVPRFRVEGKGAVQLFRSVVFDYAKRAFTETVGASGEGGR